MSMETLTLVVRIAIALTFAGLAFLVAPVGVALMRNYLSALARQIRWHRQVHRYRAAAGVSRRSQMAVATTTTTSNSNIQKGMTPWQLNTILK